MVDLSLFHGIKIVEGSISAASTPASEVSGMVLSYLEPK